MASAQKKPVSSKWQIGDIAPDFTMQTDGGKMVCLSQFAGKNSVVLYFYPKDDTPGCTTQAQGFRDHKAAFKKAGAVIIGVSKDPISKHDKFKAKHDLNFTLASDETGEVCDAYGVWVEKNMYGKKYMGIQRATFLIDPAGKFSTIWPKVKLTGHVDEVLKTLQSAS
jgi:peroxiredoxin Q/BCP